MVGIELWQLCTRREGDQVTQRAWGYAWDTAATLHSHKYRQTISDAHTTHFSAQGTNMSSHVHIRFVGFVVGYLYL